MITVYVKGRPVSFEPVFPSLGEAHLKLKELVRNGTLRSDFAMSLASKSHNVLSEKQGAWVHKIVADAVQPKECEKIELRRVTALLLLARENGIKWPKLRTRSLMVRFRKDGDLCVVSSDRETYFGVLSTKDGVLSLRRPMSQELQAELLAMNTDPVEAARLYGQITGNCCFCGHVLTHHDSIELGYGPVCAENWGLPHHSYQPRREEQTMAEERMYG